MTVVMRRQALSSQLGRALPLLHHPYMRARFITVTLYATRTPPRVRELKSLGIKGWVASIRGRAARRRPQQPAFSCRSSAMEPLRSASKSV